MHIQTLAQKVLKLLFMLLQLASTTNEEEFKHLLSSEELNFRYTCGINKPITRIMFSDKQNYAMCLHYSVLVSLAELEQLRHELAIQKFESLMHTFPGVLKSVFNLPYSL